MTRKLLLLVLLSIGACKKPAPAPDPVPGAIASEVASAAPVTPLMPPAGPPGMVYVSTKHVVGVGTDGSIHVIKPKKGALQSIVRASDGHAYALFTDSRTFQVARLDGLELVVVGEMAECDPRRRAFDARGDHFVVKCYEGFYEKKGGAEFEQLPAPPEGFDDAVWIAPNGNVWYGTDKNVSEFVNGAWMTYEKGEASFVAAPDAFFSVKNKVFMANFTSLYRADGTTLTELWKQPYTRTLLGAASNGLFGYADDKGGGVTLFTVDGAVKTIATPSSFARGATLDDAGRVWSLRDGQLAVLDTSGKLTTVPMGAYAELDGVTSLSELAVAGAGASAPPSRPIRHTKKITGTISLDGKPLANAAIEICPRSAWTFTTSTPCTGADPAISFATTTDAKGTFSIENAPMGSYYLHYKASEDRWSIDSNELAIKENAVTNLGSIAYRSRK